MSGSPGFLRWLQDKSDWLNPIVVKEVRQVVRSREFNYSFGAGLVAALAVAFFGTANALTGTPTSGGWTFGALMGCLTLLGLVVVPLGAFSALRNERMEQTLELITVTALSPSRVVIGKLLAQGVKLATLFAAMAPFIAMSFLLGGIDFVTILISLVMLFMWSLWACAACLFLSTLFKSRAMSGLVLGAAGIMLFLVLGLGRVSFFLARGAFAGRSAGATGPSFWWTLAITTTCCLATMANLVLLAENRLSVPTENRVTSLRIGFLGQFLLISAWTLAFIHESPRVQSDAVSAFGVIGGLHLAVVAMFTVTEDLVVPRRVLLDMKRPSAWGWFFAMFRPGGGRGAVYVLAQMALFLAVAWLFRPPWSSLRWLLAMCGYICFFTGVPAFAFRLMRPARAASLGLRIAVLVLLPLALVLPDLIYYVFWQPAVLDLGFSRRHLVNPFRTLANWDLMESFQWSFAPLVIGLTGLFAYLALIHLGTRMTAHGDSIDSRRSPVAEGEPGSANALY